MNLSSSYTPVDLHKLPRGIKSTSPSGRFGSPCTFDTPVIDLMTDLHRREPVSVPPDAPIDEAIVHMKMNGVRSALVTAFSGELLGLVSAADIQSEKPIRLQRERNLTRKEVTAGDIMLGVDQIPAVRLSDIAEARIGDLSRSLKQFERHHVLVITDGQDGGASVCGILSSRDIARALGFDLTPSLRATTFAELWEVLASGSVHTFSHFWFGAL